MSVNAVSGTSLQRDLASALRLARTGGTQASDASSAFTAASQATGGAAQASSSASQASTVASAPAMSNDMMTSLLQLQSDFSQLGLQNGVTTPADAAGNADGSRTADGPDAGQGAGGTAPVHHHRRHAHAKATDAAEVAQSGQSGSVADAAATSGTTPTGAAASSSDLGDGLHSFLQQVTKAIAAYATGGPVGIAAAALTSSSKA